MSLKPGRLLLFHHVAQNSDECQRNQNYTYNSLKKLLIQTVYTHICEKRMIQIKDMFKIVSMFLQFSNEKYGVISPLPPDCVHTYSTS